MAAIDFPASPTNGQTFTSGDKTWVYSTTISAWDLQAQTPTLPVGSVSGYVGATAPTGWLLCDGVTSTTGYPVLAALVGATTPNFIGKFPVGKTASGTGSTLLGTGGSTTIAETNLPSHSHANTVTSVTVAGTVAVTLAGGSHSHTGTTDSTSPSHSHAQVTQKTTNSTHTHNVNGTTAAGMSSPTDTSSDETAATAPSHTHAFTTGSTDAGVSVSGSSFTQTSGTAAMSNASTGGGTDYFQPFIAVNYIIKHDQDK